MGMPASAAAPGAAAFGADAAKAGAACGGFSRPQAASSIASQSGAAARHRQRFIGGPLASVGGSGTLLSVAMPATERPPLFSRSHVQQQMLTFPRADHLQEHLVLGLLDDGIGGHDRRAEDLQQRLASAQPSKRLVERSR